MNNKKDTVAVSFKIAHQEHKINGVLNLLLFFITLYRSLVLTSITKRHFWIALLHQLQIHP